MKGKITFKGGKGSGHHGHTGRPGKVGGSSGGSAKLEGDYSNWDFNYYQGVEMVAVNFLDSIAEFDREAQPLTSDIKILAEDIQANGIKDPLIIDYSASNGSVALIEGNHRLAAAHRLGLSHLPARVTVRKIGSVFNPSPITLPLLEPDRYGYVPGMVPPSAIAIPSLPVPTVVDK